MSSFLSRLTGTVTSSAPKNQSDQNRTAIKVFYTRSLETIVKLSKKFATTKDACNKILASIKKMDDEKKDVTADMTSNINNYFAPLKIACETRNNTIMEAALSCIEKLMAYSLINDKTPYEGDKSFSMVDIVIQTICLCFDPNQDDNVQLQIIKGLNTAIAGCVVRGKALQLAVKTCFIIHLVSKNIINQKTALSTVTQILTFVFHNLEKHANDDEEIIDDDEDVQESEVDNFSVVTKDNTKEGTSLPRTGSNSSLGSISSATSYDVNALNGAPNDDRPQTPLTDDPTKNQDSIARFVGEVIDERPVTRVKTTKPVSNPELHYRQDAFLVLKELCRLSIKKLPVVNNLESSIQMRTRVVAMQLLHEVLENSGPGFRGSKSFMKEVRRHLCMTILVNGLATYPAIFDQALSLLNILIKFFKPHLKMEIGAFLTDVFLKILNSPNSSFHQKVTIMQLLQSLSQDNQTFIDLFLNYDCCLDYKVNVFQVTIENISQAINNIQAEANWVSPQQEVTLKQHGIQTIVSMLNMFVELHRKRTKELQADEKEAMKQGRDFEQSRRKKIDLRDGMNLFNTKSANKGIDLLIRTGHLKRDPLEVAKFLATHPGLNKARIGEFIGQRDEFNSQTLKEFVALQDYKGVDFEIAFRNYLNTFRIPGEGQVIDRIVEAFAERYYHQNSSDSIFATFDAVHIFAFSIIMLNTELHSPALGVRPRMDLQGFINNNKGINDGNDINKDYLTKIFNNIKQTEIKLQEDVEMLQDQNNESQMSGLPLLKRKQMLYDRETEKIIRNTKAVFGDGKKVKQEKPNAPELVENKSGTPHVATMFEIAWKPSLECLDSVYDLIVDERQFTQLCLRAFECGIHIAARYDISDARTAYVNCVAKYGDVSPLLSEVRLLQKNVDCIKLMLKIVDTEGDYLRDSWQPILNCVSQLELLLESLKGKNGAYASQYTMMQNMSEMVKIMQLQAQQLKAQQNGSTIMRDMLGAMAINPVNQGANGGIGGEGATVVNMSSTGVINSTGALVDYITAQGLLQQLESHFIDTIFIKSAELSNDAVVDFVKSLCWVSLNKEINTPIAITLPTVEKAEQPSMPMATTPTQLQPNIPQTPRDSRQSLNLAESVNQLQQQFEPRRFSLLKLTEVAYFNMSRKEKIVWALMWYYMADHYVAVACHSNEGIANYAIDSARTLVLAFMEHQEMLEAIPNFQTSLIHPFLKAVQQGKSHVVREIIVKSVGTIIVQRHAVIKNGWKTVLDVFSNAVQIQDTNVQFIMQSYKEYIDNMIMQKGNQTHFDEICEARAFPDLVTCLLSFAKKLPFVAPSDDNRRSMQSLDDKGGEKRSSATDAIEAIATCANHLGTGVLAGVRKNQEEGVIHFTESDSNLWFPILQGLCKLVSDDPRTEIRARALATVTQVLKNHGGKFDSKLWGKIFSEILCHMFDNIQPQHPTAEIKEEKKEEAVFKPPASRWKGLASSVVVAPVEQKEEKKEEKPVEIVIERSVMTNDSLWVRTTCEQALLNVVELFDHFYNLISFVFDDLVKLIISCFRQENGNKVSLSARLSKIGQNVLVKLIELSGNKLNSEQWESICKSISKLVTTDMNATTIIFQACTPKEGTDKNTLTPLTNITSAFVNTQGVIHYQMIQIIQQVLVTQLGRANTTLTVDHVKQLLGSLYASYAAAKTINESDIIMKVNKGLTNIVLPTKMLLDQETAAIGVYLALLFKMLSCTVIEGQHLKEPCLRLAETLILPISTELVNRYLTKAEIVKETEEYKAVNSSEMIELIPIVVQILNGFHNDCTPDQFDSYADTLYEPLSNLVLSEHRVIRVALRHVFIRAKDI